MRHFPLFLSSIAQSLPWKSFDSCFIASIVPRISRITSINSLLSSLVSSAFLRASVLPSVRFHKKSPAIVPKITKSCVQSMRHLSLFFSSTVQTRPCISLISLWNWFISCRIDSLNWFISCRIASTWFCIPKCNGIVTPKIVPITRKIATKNSQYTFLPSTKTPKVQQYRLA